MAKKDKKAASQEKESLTEGISQKFKQRPVIYIGSVVILVLVVVTFVGGDLLSGGLGARMGDLNFGYYDNVPISWIPGNMLTQNFNRVRDFYQSRGLQVDDMWTQAQIMREAYEFTVVHTAILRILNRSNFSVPDRTVDRHVAQLPHFQDGGRFSPELFNRMPESSRVALWRQVQDDLNRMVFDEALFGLLIPETEAAFIAGMAGPMRSFEMVSFQVDDYPESEVLSFGMENSELFSSVHLSRITLNSEREAGRVLDLVRSGVILFEDAARSHSQDGFADRGGDIGIRFFHDLDWEIPSLADRRAVFSLETGEISEVINTGNGWAFFRIEEDLIYPDFDDEAIMSRVRSHIRNFQGGRMEDWAIAQAEDFIEEAKELGFENAARWRFLERHSFGPLPINFGGSNLFTSLDAFSGSFNFPGFNPQDVENIASNENFWRIAFSAELNVPSAPFVHGNNVLVFFPTEQVELDEDTRNHIESWYTDSWLFRTTEQSMRNYFLNHERMEDNFWEVYFRYFMN